MILYGAGGHARAVNDRLKELGLSVIGIFDDNPAVEKFGELAVNHRYEDSLFPGEEILITIGSNAKRLELSHVVQHTPGKLLDKTAIISSSADIGNGSMVMAGTVIQAYSIIGEHCIINTGAIVEHDCILKDFVHVAPGAVLCASVKLGKGVFVGANATILPGVIIGDWSVVGAGSVVTGNVASGVTVVGNPSKPIHW